MIQLPNNKKCYNLPEQVAQNLLNIQYLAEQYKNIDELPAIWQSYKETFDAEQETFEGWTTTFEGWDNTLSTYLANMSSAAVGAIAGQNIAPANVAATGNITAPSIIENMTGYSFTKTSNANLTREYLYAGVVKNGNKITFCIFLKLNRTGSVEDSICNCGTFNIPASIGARLFPYQGSWLESKKVYLSSGYNSGTECYGLIFKDGNEAVRVNIYGINSITENTDYVVRVEVTFLLSDNLAA